jgi:hypothetical protein
MTESNSIRYCGLNSLLYLLYNFVKRTVNAMSLPGESLMSERISEDVRSDAEAVEAVGLSSCIEGGTTHVGSNIRVWLAEQPLFE